MNIKLTNYIFLTLIVLLGLSSCSQMTEEIYIEKNGSGEYVMYSDMVAGAKVMAEQMFLMFEQLDTTGEMSAKIEENKEQNMQNMIDEMVWKDFPNEIDSVSNFYEMYRDSFKTKEQIEFSKRTNFFMKGSREEGFINSGIRFKFNKNENLGDFFQIMGEMYDKDEGASPMGPIGSPSDMGIGYSISKKRIARTSDKSNSSPPPSSEDMEMMEKFMTDSKFKTIIHTKRKIKSVVGDGLVSKEDYKVIFEYDLLDLMNHSISSDFEILFY